MVGLRHIREEVVTTQIESRPGRPYSQSVADADIVRLDRLRVFAAISLTPSPEGGGVRVTVRVEETPRVLPIASFAVTDESGASIGPAIRVLNFNGQPRDVSLLARFGGEQVYELNETSPFLTGRRLWHRASVTFRDRRNRLNGFDERSLDLDARIGMRASDTWRAGAIVQLYGIRSDQSGTTLSSDNADRIAGLGAVAERDSRDSWTMPTRGWVNAVDLIWHGGDGHYATFDLDVRRFQPIALRHTLVATGLLTLQSGTSGVDVPTYFDYSLGGENSVRGWSFGSRRGKNQFIASVEHRYTVAEPRPVHLGGLTFYGGVALAAFADLGSAWSASDDFSRNLIAGGGFGLRLFVPYVNVIRLDLSFGHGLQGQLGIDEKAVAQRSRVR